tara:strand:- start:90 stop:791 length:702 start_codon:yes stop_codon:yes gene_type:complete
MSNDAVTLELHSREPGGTRVVRRLRKDGVIPGVIYGQGNKPRSFYVLERELRSATSGGQRLNSIFKANLEGESDDLHVIIKDYQVHPTRSRIMHLDLQEINLKQTIQSSVAIEIVGHAPGLVEGGILNVIERNVLLEALPMDFPEHVELSIEGMAIGDSRLMADLEIPGGVKLLSDPEALILTLAVTRVAVVEEEVAEGDELEEGEEAEGEDTEGSEEGTSGEATSDEDDAGS